MHEIGSHEGQPYLVMDYTAGPTLAPLCAGRPVTPRRAATYFKKIAEALHDAHEHGVLHRDLEPSNVLVDSDDEPHVTDFGLAKRFSDQPDSALQVSELTVSGQVLGSPGYMAPEQAGGRKNHIGREADVYALGAILFHRLTGRPPLIAETITDTARMVLENDPIVPGSLVLGIPKDLETVCLKCLQMDPRRRYASALHLA